MPYLWIFIMGCIFICLVALLVYGQAVGFGLVSLGWSEGRCVCLAWGKEKTIFNGGVAFEIGRAHV